MRKHSFILLKFFLFPLSLSSSMKTLFVAAFSQDKGKNGNKEGIKEN